MRPNSELYNPFKGVFKPKNKFCAAVQFFYLFPLSLYILKPNFWNLRVKTLSVMVIYHILLGWGARFRLSSLYCFFTFSNSKMMKTETWALFNRKITKKLFDRMIIKFCSYCVLAYEDTIVLTGCFNNVIVHISLLNFYLFLKNTKTEKPNKQMFILIRELIKTPCNSVWVFHRITGTKEVIETETKGLASASIWDWNVH